MKSKNYRFWYYPALILAACGAWVAYSFYDSKQNDLATYCYGDGNYIAKSLLIYAKRNGRFPSAGWDKERSCPHWVQALYEIDKEIRLKCPADDSKSTTSYEFNPALAGHDLSDFNKKDQRIMILKEKQHRKTHSRVFYLCGSAGDFCIITGREGRK